MTFMRNIMNLLKLPDSGRLPTFEVAHKNESTIHNENIDAPSTTGTNKTRNKKIEIKNKFSESDYDTFLWQCNSVSEERYKDTASEFSMKLENPNDTLEVGYHYAMKEIADEIKR